MRANPDILQSADLIEKLGDSFDKLERAPHGGYDLYRHKGHGGPYFAQGPNLRQLLEDVHESIEFDRKHNIK